MVSFLYLIGLSYGIFSVNKDIDVDSEEYTNIINFEELNPISENTSELADYFSFCKTSSTYKNIAYTEVLNMFLRKNIFKKVVFEKIIVYKYLLYTYQSNRPPPSDILN